VSDSYQGRVLQWIMPSGILEEGEIVYCFAEDEKLIRVQPRRLIFNVNQINFPIEFKNKFKIVQ